MSDLYSIEAIETEVECIERLQDVYSDVITRADLINIHAIIMMHNKKVHGSEVITNIALKKLAETLDDGERFPRIVTIP